MKKDYDVDAMREFFPDAVEFMEGFKVAEKWKLQWEYMQAFLEDFRTHGKAGQAAAHAVYEWDM